MSEDAEKVFEDPQAVSQSATICNDKGLHARASAKFVRMAEQFDAEVAVRREGAVVGGTSIMGLMMLAAAKGCEVEVAASGEEAGTALQSLIELIEQGFGEIEDLPPKG
ncbi:HPr family phosphocarrier protein [Tepidamorphus sp. 3E244]|uniref:HPr family phosphocarrier protein n=1 Tax=Tepidamorphus sp. 3E244 TaxID=3385498 RepID=UPI0038FC602C